MIASAQEHGVPVRAIGHVTEANGAFRVRLDDARIEQPVTRLRDVYFTAIPRRMGD